VSILSAGTFTGALLSNPISDRLGRKWGLIFSCAIFSLGVGLQLDTHWASFIVGRVVAGAGGQCFSPPCPRKFNDIEATFCTQSAPYPPLFPCTNPNALPSQFVVLLLGSTNSLSVLVPCSLRSFLTPLRTKTPIPLGVPPLPFSSSGRLFFRWAWCSFPNRRDTCSSEARKMLRNVLLGD